MIGEKTIGITKLKALWMHGINPFSLWAFHGTWSSLATLASFIVIIKLAGAFTMEGTYSDPFAHYDALLPGHAVEALAAYPCTFVENRVNGQLNQDHETCIILPQNEPFDIIHVEVRHQHIETVTFYTTALQLGNAALHWPMVSRLRSGQKEFKWSAIPFKIEAIGPSLCYQCVVRMVTVGI